jgi:hypothetical protein
MAESFLGVNFITTSKCRQDSSGELDLDARLSITDVSKDLFVVDDNNNPQHIIHPTIDEVQNVCQRQGRCGLGCIPDSRHS